jgi:hypothetical protein
VIISPIFRVVMWFMQSNVLVFYLGLQIAYEMSHFVLYGDLEIYIFKKSFWTDNNRRSCACLKLGSEWIPRTCNIWFPFWSHSWSTHHLRGKPNCWCCSDSCTDNWHHKARPIHTVDHSHSGPFTQWNSQLDPFIQWNFTKWITEGGRIHAAFK